MIEAKFAGMRGDGGLRRSERNVAFHQRLRWRPGMYNGIRFAANTQRRYLVAGKASTDTAALITELGGKTASCGPTHVGDEVPEKAFVCSPVSARPDVRRHGDVCTRKYCTLQGPRARTDQKINSGRTRRQYSSRHQPSTNPFYLVTVPSASQTSSRKTTARSTALITIGADEEVWFILFCGSLCEPGA